MMYPYQLQFAAFLIIRVILQFHSDNYDVVYIACMNVILVIY